MAEYLLVFEVLLVLLGTRYLFARDRLAGLYFLFLGIYAIPAQIGYLYLPELSELIQAYFGEAVWMPATGLVITSLTAFLITFRWLRNPVLASIPISLHIQPAPRPNFRILIGVGLIAALLAYEALYLLLNFGDISWQTAQDEDITGASLGYFLFIAIFKQLVAVCLILYAVVRQGSRSFPKWIQRLFLLLSLALFLAIAAKLGNRTDLVAVTLGIVAYETARTRVDAKFLLRFAIGLLLVLVLLIGVEIGRTENAQESTGLTVAVLSKDYYAPAHMLFAAISFDFVEPLEVIRSNTANALVKLNVPYLQATITDLFRPDLATRSAGYAFYVFTEGYMFMGLWGFIYNGLVLSLGLILWRKVASTNSREFNLFLMALLGSMIVNVVRGQTSYFVKYLYTFVLPGMLIYCAIMGQRLSLRWSSGRHRANAPAAVL